MEEKIIKQIKTSCPFPLLQYKATVKYNEVRKASGIAYILLDLIQKSTAKEEKIADELLRFGISADLYGIFGRELERLAATDIIACGVNMRYLSELRYFSEIKLSDLKLTERGEKLPLVLVVHFELMETLAEEVARLFRERLRGQREQCCEFTLLLRLIPADEFQVALLICRIPLEHLPERNGRDFAEVVENLVPVVPPRELPDDPAELPPVINHELTSPPAAL